MRNTLATHSALRTWLVPSLVLASAVAWLISLLLPGFSLGPDRDIWLGGQILFAGLLFGWGFGGWAVYANIFFVIAVVRLLMGKVPMKSALGAVLLAATVPLFKGVPRDEGTGIMLTVQSWGAGAALWLFSIVTVLLAVVIQGWIGVEQEAVSNAL